MKTAVEKLTDNLFRELSKLNTLSEKLHKEHNKISNYGQNWSVAADRLIERIYEIGDAKAILQSAIEKISRMTL